MMKIRQDRLEAFCNILRALVPECRLKITDDGWNTMAVDTANVAMVSCRMPATAFEGFQVEPAEIGVDVEKWIGMLKIMNDPKSTITIDLPPTTGKVHITDGKYTYKLALLDANTIRKRPNPPGLTLPAAIVVDAKELQEVVRAMSVIGDKVRITAAEGIALETGGDSDHLRKVLDPQEGSKPVTESVSSLFSLDYLRDISKAMKDAGTVTVHVGKNHPVRFDFELEGMECSYLVAPRIEQEDAA